MFYEIIYDIHETKLQNQKQAVIWKKEISNGSKTIQKQSNP